jgi:hypothetical protein
MKGCPKKAAFLYFNKCTKTRVAKWFTQRKEESAMDTKFFKCVIKES